MIKFKSLRTYDRYFNNRLKGHTFERSKCSFVRKADREGFGVFRDRKTGRIVELPMRIKN